MKKTWQHSVNRRQSKGKDKYLKILCNDWIWLFTYDIPLRDLKWIESKYMAVM
jgi:hypothetical protein